MCKFQARVLVTSSLHMSVVAESRDKAFFHPLEIDLRTSLQSWGTKLYRSFWTFLRYAMRQHLPICPNWGSKLWHLGESNHVDLKSNRQQTYLKNKELLKFTNWQSIRSHFYVCVLTVWCLHVQRLIKTVSVLIATRFPSFFRFRCAARYRWKIDTRRDSRK